MSVSDKYWPKFVEHASLEAIALEREFAERALSNAHAHVNRVRALEFKRRRQIEAGLWPSPEETHHG